MQKINLDKPLKIFFYFLTTFLIIGFVYIFIRVENINSLLKENLGSKTTVTEEENKSLTVSDACGEICKEEIKKEVSDAVSSISGKTTTIIQKEPVNASATKVAYVPLSGPITSTSTGWVDAAGTDVYIDLTGDYGKTAKASWDAFLKVAHGNGIAFARLYDVTHGIGVDGSEVSITDKETSTQVSSGNLSFWAGRNLYRVQIKSLNSFEVTFGSGRIKITY